MAQDANSDHDFLLERPASIWRDQPREYDLSYGHELEEMDVPEMATHKGSYASLNPPSYRSLSDEQHTDHDGKSFGTHQRVGSLQSTSTFATFTSRSKPAVKNGWARFLRWFLRSGSHGSHLGLKRSDISYQPSKWSGWRGGCLAAAYAAGIVLLINVIFTIWAAVSSNSGTKIGSLYEGGCSTVHKADSWLHIAINAMGTCLLGASNYTMQCLSSPTRKEVDKAHSRGRYLDIGLPSIRNLRGWGKRLLSPLLVCSTLPLHFLWNSAVFTTTQELDYMVYLVTPRFFDQSPVDCSQNVSSHTKNSAIQTPILWAATPLAYENTTIYGGEGYLGGFDSNETWYQADACSVANQLQSNDTIGNLTRLSNAECLNAYGKGNALMKKYGNLLVVTKDQPDNSNSTILLQFRYQAYVSNYTGNNWICGPDHLLSNHNKCNYKDIVSNASSWSLGGPLQHPQDNHYELAPIQEHEIDYCLSQPTDAGGKCQLQYSLVIMICVIIANFIKFACIVCFLWGNHEPVLATVGDGIASFLQRPDPTTVDRPFLSRSQAKEFKMAAKSRPVRWNMPKRALRWWHAPSSTRWTITLILCVVAIACTIYLLSEGNTTFVSKAPEGTSPWSIGFGAYSSYAVLTMNSNTVWTTAAFSSNKILIGMVAIANIPQVIVSTLYFAHNTIYTSMLSAREWAGFSTHAKSLRTTFPRGLQRSTYWLSLPWTYGLPLAVSSSILHWLISQALFVARTEILDTNGVAESDSYMQIGYSPIAILCAMLFGTSLVLAMIINGFRKLKPTVLVGNNSLAISAACHRPDWEEGAELGRVRWGAISHEENEKGPGHCCFSGSEGVEMPREGALYI